MSLGLDVPAPTVAAGSGISPASVNLGLDVPMPEVIGHIQIVSTTPGDDETDVPVSLNELVVTFDGLAYIGSGYVTVMKVGNP